MTDELDLKGDTDDEPPTEARGVDGCDRSGRTNARYMKPLEEEPSRSYKRTWLAVPAVVGVGLILYNLRHTQLNGTNDHNALPGVLSDVGVTLLLFSVLFWFEKRIERRIIKSIQVLSQRDLESKQQHLKADPLIFGDFEGDTGPMACATAFMEAIASRDFGSLWLLSDPNLRQCRAQAWIFNNFEDLDLAAQPSATWVHVSEYLSNGPHRDEPLWESFAETEMTQLAEVFEGYEEGGWGWSQRRRIVGPEYEVILLAPLPKEAPYGFVAHGPTLIDDACKLLMHCVDRPPEEGPRFYLVAGFGEAAPLPGWPPTWWIVDDPVAVMSHAGATATSSAGKAP